MRQLLRNTSAELLTLTGRFFVPEYAVLPDDVNDLDDSDEAMAWMRFADTVRPHEELEPFPGYNAIQKLEAVYAASDNKLVMETHHLDGYNLLNMVGYQVAQRLMLAAMIDVAAICATGESCWEGEQCETLAESGPRTCETAADFCRTSQQADRLGICDAFPATVRVRHRVRPTHGVRLGHGRQLHRRLLGSSAIKRVPVATRRRRFQRWRRRGADDSLRIIQPDATKSSCR